MPKLHAQLGASKKPMPPPSPPHPPPPSPASAIRRPFCFCIHQAYLSIFFSAPFWQSWKEGGRAGGLWPFSVGKNVCNGIFYSIAKDCGRIKSKKTACRETRWVRPNPSHYLVGISNGNLCLKISRDLKPQAVMGRMPSHQFPIQRHGLKCVTVDKSTQHEMSWLRSPQPIHFFLNLEIRIAKLT